MVIVSTCTLRTIQDRINTHIALASSDPHPHSEIFLWYIYYDFHMSFGTILQLTFIAIRILVLTWISLVIRREVEDMGK